MYVAAPIVDRGDGHDRIVGVLTVAKPNQTIAPFIARSQGTILRWGFVLLGTALADRRAGGVVAVAAARRAAPLRRCGDRGRTGRAAGFAGEFGDLGRALETMRDRLEGKQYVEQYVHALTHELKSPLAAIRGSAELVESGGEAMLADDRARFLATIRAQGDRMAEMVDKMLALAAVEHRQRIEQPQAVDLVGAGPRGRGTPAIEAHATPDCGAHGRADRRS